MADDPSLFGKIEPPVLIASKHSAVENTVIHYHNACELVFFEHADLRVFCHNRWYEVRDNMLMWIPEYQLHRIEYRQHEMYSRTVLNIRIAFLFEAIHSLGLESLLNDESLSHFHIQRLTQEQGRRIRLLMDVCSEANAAYTKNPSAGNSGILKTVLLTLLTQVLTYRTEESSSVPHLPQTHIRILTHYIDTHYQENISLDFLAEMVHLDKHYMCHMFKSQMNMTVIRYVQYRRVIEAQKRLLYTDLPINVIAAECGFNSLQHFYKVFRDVSGYTPGDYQEQSVDC